MTQEQFAAISRQITECTVHIRAARGELAQYKENQVVIDKAVSKRRQVHAVKNVQKDAREFAFR